MDNLNSKILLIGESVKLERERLIAADLKLDDLERTYFASRKKQLISGHVSLDNARNKRLARATQRQKR
jgi:hypothetical protein